VAHGGCNDDLTHLIRLLCRSAANTDGSALVVLLLEDSLRYSRRTGHGLSGRQIAHSPGEGVTLSDQGRLRTTPRGSIEQVAKITKFTEHKNSSENFALDEDDILPMRCHGDSGSLVWNADVHDRRTGVFADIAGGSDRRIPQVIRFDRYNM
jgi:hypothetical protein